MPAACGRSISEILLPGGFSNGFVLNQSEHTSVSQSEFEFDQFENPRKSFKLILGSLDGVIICPESKKKMYSIWGLRTNLGLVAYD